MLSQTPSRREVLQSGSYLALALAGYLRPSLLTASEDASKILDRQPWGYLQELANGVWAVVSTPLTGNDWTTGCNGGLIAGKERVLAIESFVEPAGAHWLGEQAQKLTGRLPTDVLITHFHGDHANGIEGYSGAHSPKLWTTQTTLDLVRDGDSQEEDPPTDERLGMLESANLLADRNPTEIDLGGRMVRLHPRRGHTPSDVTAELDEPSIVFCGDLVWNGLFPNYRDTEASAFTHNIRALLRRRETTYISGHGALSDGADVEVLLDLVESVGEAAKGAHKKGLSHTEGAAEFQLPAAVADWKLFNPKYFEVAFKAWYQELG